jgi:DNA-binding transcriptional ArsR family regulator
MDLVCAHLARLSSTGLIKRRRSGAWCYCIAESPYGREAFSGKITSWLAEALRRPTRTMNDCRVGRLKNPGPADVETQLHHILFDAATAFTNVRRIQILRRLAMGEAVAAQAMSKDLGMSQSAVSRHTAKLLRRGYVDGCRAGRYLEFRLATKFKTPLHARLFGIVRSEWEKGELRS